MNKITFGFCLSILFVATTVSIISAQTPPRQTAAAKTKLTVVDYFLLLPNKYVANLSRAARQKRLKNFGTTDIGNGYLEILAQNEKQSNIYAAIFKKDAGDYLIAIQSGTNNAGAKFRYNLLEYDGRTWTDVSQKMLPANFKFADYDENRSSCELPRYNRTITCRDAQNQLVYLGWTGKEFVIE